MSTTMEATAVPRPIARSTSAIRTAERRFYLVFNVVLASSVVLGFARTFFFRAWYPEWAAAHGAPERIFYLHGTVFALWYVLLVVQASLISARRVALHRRLGFVGAALAAAMVVLGTLGALVAARRPTGFIDIPLPPLQFLVVPLAAIVLFAVFVAMAIVRRRDTQAHKRYMLLASIVMLEAAVGRWPFAFVNAPSPIPFFDMPSLVTDSFLIPLVLWDIRSRGRLHSATMWGAIIIVASHVLRMPLAATSGWQAFAAWAVQLLGTR
ncbi:MAG TPA: hypothetical protein VH740_27805 [Vicinamibacterales bacterium]